MATKQETIDNRLRTLALVEATLRAGTDETAERLSEDIMALVPDGISASSALLDLLSFAAVTLEAFCDEVSKSDEYPSPSPTPMEFLGLLRSGLLA